MKSIYPFPRRSPDCALGAPQRSGCTQGNKAPRLTLLPRIRLLRRWVNKPLRNCHAEPPAAAVSEKERRFRLLLRCQVVGGHQLDRRPREDALAAVLAPDDA